MDMIDVEFKVASILDIKPADRKWPLVALPRIGDRISFTKEGFEWTVKGVTWMTAIDIDKPEDGQISKVLITVY